ncbi:PCYCGC motif-containing (lipo)protein [Sporosarcina sp. G11-34]|nr:PCYCGC domain-containing protein [Sporosarcina sp. G11-34]
MKKQLVLLLSACGAKSYEGDSLKEIRDVIDETYKEGYAEPTNTPMPS